MTNQYKIEPYIANCLQCSQTSSVFTVLKRPLHATCSIAIEGMRTIAASRDARSSTQQQEYRSGGVTLANENRYPCAHAVCAHNP